MTVSVYPKKLNGTVEIPSSKSQLHRLLICAALAGGAEIKISGEISDDIAATIDCIGELGVSCKLKTGVICVKKIREPFENAGFRCGESGSTLRFMMPIVGALGYGGRFYLDDGLRKRPHDEIIRILCENGCKIADAGSEISVSGKLAGDCFSVRGDISSQYISGLIMALPLIGGGKITVTDGLQSADYVKLTMETVKLFGCLAAFESGNTISVSGKYTEKFLSFTSGSDDSLAVFWRAANMLGSDIRFEESDHPFLFSNSSVIDGSQIPDYIPVTALTAAVGTGKTEFVNCGRLRYKESERIKSTVNLINNLGGKATETNDGFYVEGVSCFAGGCVNGENDHRIVMTAAIASCICKNPVIINGADAVKKSYPSFFEDFVALGGAVKEV